MLRKGIATGEKVIKVIMLKKDNLPRLRQVIFLFIIVLYESDLDGPHR